MLATRVSNPSIPLSGCSIQNWSFFLDFKIVFLTFYNIVKGDEQAYRIVDVMFIHNYQDYAIWKKELAQHKPNRVSFDNE
ncbi:MAG: hypothetical protein EOP21_09795 [Hyphomicrobiales bacterium]|nr:MAG: hypothetical protein EOP21_09795 [Hyphomicrobiales bacterium]